ncbi:MAG: hypothetical protein RRY53_01155 [Pseudoflavonifractor sp.]
MEQEKQKALDSMEQAAFFLLMIMLSLLLSLRGLGLQRDGVLGCAVPPVFPLKNAAGALVVGASGFFLCMALGERSSAAAGGDRTARHTADVNAIAALLVLIAAVLRLWNLRSTAQTSPALAQADLLPE